MIPIAARSHLTAPDASNLICIPVAPSSHRTNHILSLHPQPSPTSHSCKYLPQSRGRLSHLAAFASVRASGPQVEPNRYRNAVAPQPLHCLNIDRQPIFNLFNNHDVSLFWRLAACPIWRYPCLFLLCETVAVAMPSYNYLPRGLEMTLAWLRRGSGGNFSLPWTDSACMPADLRPRPAHWVLLTGPGKDSCIIWDFPGPSRGWWPSRVTYGCQTSMSRLAD